MKIAILFAAAFALFGNSSVRAGLKPELSFESHATTVRSQITGTFLKTAALRAQAQQEEESLLALMRDRDPSVRQAAVKAFKNYVARRSDYRSRVLAMVSDSSEVLEVKREAVKTLSIVTGYSDVYERLLDIARLDYSQALRVISYKALYHQAAARSDVRDRIVDAARREGDKEVRRAAIWSLFLATPNNSARDPLIDIVRRDGDSDIRVEALKSLYGTMGYSEVRDLVMDLARRTSTDKPLRHTAILTLSARTSNDAAALLQSIARNDHDPEARRAAILALGDPRSEEIIRHFHLVRRDINGLPIGDPLDYE